MTRKFCPFCGKQDTGICEDVSVGCRIVNVQCNACHAQGPTVSGDSQSIWPQDQDPLIEACEALWDQRS